MLKLTLVANKNFQITLNSLILQNRFLPFMRKLTLLLGICGILFSCSEYQKVYKSEEIAPKFKLGEQLYNEGNYKKAQRLFEQIVPGYRGKPGAEKLMYMYGNCFYELEDFQTASYQLERFVKGYPRSEKLEEMSFKAAKSTYYGSPRFSLDQEETDRAILKLQNFMNQYPDSQYFKEASDLALELDKKLQTKYYEIAKGFHHRITGGSPFKDDYTAAITAFDNFLRDYPGSEYKEKALYYKFETAYLLAENSVDKQKKERFESAIKYFDKWKQFSKGSSDFDKDATKLREKINAELEKFNNQ